MLLLLWDTSFNYPDSGIEDFLRLLGSVNLCQHLFLLVMVNQSRSFLVVHLHPFLHSIRFIIFPLDKRVSALVACILLFWFDCHKIVKGSAFAAVPPCSQPADNFLF